MPSSAASTHRPIDWAFVRARLGSFLAVVPLSFWTANHLWNNLSAFHGAEAWTADVTTYAHPVAFFASSLVALLPIALHTVWGVSRLASARPNVVRFSYLSNLRYLLQRVSAVGVLLFLGAHLWLATLQPRLDTGRPEPFHVIAREMHHHAPTLIVYVLGTLGVAYHLANGLGTFCMGWGVVSSRRGLKQVDVLVWVVFLSLLAMGWGAIYAIWDAGR